MGRFINAAMIASSSLVVFRLARAFLPHQMRAAMSYSWHHHRRISLLLSRDDLSSLLSPVGVHRRLLSNDSIYDDDDDDDDDDENGELHVNVKRSTDRLGMENIYSEWTLEDDRLLYENRHLSLVKLASLLGRGMHGVESRIKKINDVSSMAYFRLFGAGGKPDECVSSDADSGSNRLTPAKEVLRRIKWDETLQSSSFTILHYDRVQDTLAETPFDAPNDSISGAETSFVFALPEHRIEKVKYLERVVWDKASRIDCVFGSMNGNGVTIDHIINTYTDWKKERDERIDRDRRRQIEVLEELGLVLGGESRLKELKEQSSQLIRGEWDSDSVRDYVKRVGSLYYEAMKENEEGDANEDEDDGTDIIDFLHLFSDLVALLHDESLREAILNEVESGIERSRGVASSKSNQLGRALPPELDEDDLEEKFVKGSGAGGQKVNKTSNRVILTHLPTQVRVECQDTRSLQQNRKIARKRLRLKVDAFLNGEKSLIGQKAKIAVTKKAKNKDRNKRRRQQKENQPDV